MITVAYCVVVTGLLGFIAYMIVDNVMWQEQVRRNAGIIPKKKVKLKKGQRIAFQDGESNPFEEKHANSSP